MFLKTEERPQGARSQVLADEIERVARQASEAGEGRLCLMLNALDAKQIITALRGAASQGL